jgi:hypothetical protein
MSEQAGEPPESDMRRRAAWLLGMLALVAVLFAALMITFLGGSSPKKSSGVGIDDTAGPPPAPASTQSKPRHHHAAHSSTPSSGSPTTSAPPGHASCPTSAPCGVSTDIGNAVAAINALRTQSHLSPVTGTLSQAAQTCALSNGSQCTGAWAETYLSTPDGAAAIAKIPSRSALLEPSLKSVQYGWAYNPTQKMYYLAVIRGS